MAWESVVFVVRLYYLFLTGTSFPFLQGLLARVFGLLYVDLIVHHEIDLFYVYQLSVKVSKSLINCNICLKNIIIFIIMLLTNTDFMKQTQASPKQQQQFH